MKCEICLHETENIRECGFHVGNRTGYSNGNQTYQITTSPFTGYVCKRCINLHREMFISFHRKYLKISGISIIVFFISIFVFYFLNLDGWKVFSIVASSISAFFFLGLLASLWTDFNKDEIGDRTLLFKYTSELKSKGYDTYCTRSGYQQNKFNPI